jgi:hypothetical protein
MKHAGEGKARGGRGEKEVRVTEERDKEMEQQGNDMGT